MRTFGASLMFYLICECYSSTAAAQHSSKAIGCSPCFNAGRNSNRHEKLSLAHFYMTRWKLLPILSYYCPLWLLPLAAASFDCWLMLPSVTSFGHWLTDIFNTPLNTAAIHWLLSFTLTAAFIGCCSASFGLHTCWLAFCQVTFNATFKIPLRSSTFRVYQTRYENYIFQLPFLNLRQIWEHLPLTGSQFCRIEKSLKININFRYDFDCSIAFSPEFIFI